MAKLSEILKERGYVYQHSSEKLAEITDGKKRTLYLGIDPSADSLQVGQLQAFLILRRFIEDGHKVILLVGGGTGMIGDPGGRSDERNLLDAETVERNAEARFCKRARQECRRRYFVHRIFLRAFAGIRFSPSASGIRG